MFMCLVVRVCVFEIVRLSMCLWRCVFGSKHHILDMSLRQSWNRVQVLSCNVRISDLTMGNFARRWKQQQQQLMPSKINFLKGGFCQELKTITTVGVSINFLQTVSSLWLCWWLWWHKFFLNIGTRPIVLKWKDRNNYQSNKIASITMIITQQAQIRYSIIAWLKMEKATSSRGIKPAT